MTTVCHLQQQTDENEIFKQIPLKFLWTLLPSHPPLPPLTQQQAQKVETKNERKPNDNPKNTKGKNNKNVFE